jgi:hypothetical protein
VSRVESSQSLVLFTGKGGGKRYRERAKKRLDAGKKKARESTEVAFFFLGSSPFPYKDTYLLSTI